MEQLSDIEQKLKCIRDALIGNLSVPPEVGSGTAAVNEIKIDAGINVNMPKYDSSSLKKALGHIKDALSADIFNIGLNSVMASLMAAAGQLIAAAISAILGIILPTGHADIGKLRQAAKICREIIKALSLLINMLTISLTGNFGLGVPNLSNYISGIKRLSDKYFGEEDPFLDPLDSTKELEAELDTEIISVPATPPEVLNDHLGGTPMSPKDPSLVAGKLQRNKDTSNEFKKMKQKEMEKYQASSDNKERRQECLRTETEDAIKKKPIINGVDKPKSPLILTTNGIKLNTDIKIPSIDNSIFGGVESIIEDLSMFDSAANADLLSIGSQLKIPSISSLLPEVSDSVLKFLIDKCMWFSAFEKLLLDLIAILMTQHQQVDLSGILDGLVANAKCIVAGIKNSIMDSLEMALDCFKDFLKMLKNLFNISIDGFLNIGISLSGDCGQGSSDMPSKNMEGCMTCMTK